MPQPARATLPGGLANSPLDVAVIIVNYGTADLAVAAAESVLSRQHGGLSVEVHLVDNASPGDDRARIAQTLAESGLDGQVTFYPETTNHGFGRGNNVVLTALAARPAPPRYVFLLNPDARLENEAIETLVSFLDRTPEAAAAGARISQPDSGPVTAAFRFPGILSTFEGAMAFGPVSRMLAASRVPLAPDLDTRAVGWVAGAAVMMRFSAVLAAGCFDPTYFLYFEEVDLMRQLSRRGGQIWYVAEAHVLHAEGVSTGVKSGEGRRRRPAYWYQSWHHYFRKNHGRGGALVAAAAWIVGAAGNHVVSNLRRRPPAAPLHFYHDFWCQAVRPLLGLRPRAYD